MYHPTTRVLTILELLGAGGPHTGGGWGRPPRLEVDRRTVRRYITMLQELGIPIEATTGRLGGYRLRPGFKLPPLIFTDDEAVALVLGLLAARHLGFAADTPAIEGALAKIDRVLPEAVRERVGGLPDTVALDLGTGRERPATPLVATLSAAIRRGRAVRLRYRAPGRAESARDIDPYGIVYHAGAWYVVGHCHLRDAVRTFRLDRIHDVAIGGAEATFARPPDIDPLAVVRRALASVPRTWRARVTLHTSPEDARARLPASLAAVEARPEGALLRCTTDNLRWLAGMLAALECDFVIHEPPELRDAVRHLAARLELLADEG